MSGLCLEQRLPHRSRAGSGWVLRTQCSAQTLRVMQEGQISHTRQECASLIPPSSKKYGCVAALLPFKELCSAQQSPRAELSPAQPGWNRGSRGHPGICQLCAVHHCPSPVLGVLWVLQTPQELCGALGLDLLAEPVVPSCGFILPEESGVFQRYFTKRVRHK